MPGWPACWWGTRTLARVTSAPDQRGTRAFCGRARSTTRHLVVARVTEPATDPSPSQGGRRKDLSLLPLITGRSRGLSQPGD